MVDRTARRIPNLDGLRFFAAFVVLIVHIQGTKKSFNIKFFESRFIENSSHIAVTFFFVLSGFLINFFLIREKENSSISSAKFYKREDLKDMAPLLSLAWSHFFYFPSFPRF